MNKPLITFVMQAYNAESTIEQAIQSVLCQTERNILLIVRDNGSTDRTAQICRTLALGDSRLLLLSNRKNGMTDDGHRGCSNKDWWGLTEETTGDYISIVDSDDWIIPDFSKRMLEAAQKTNAEIVACGNFFMDESGQKILGQRQPPELFIADLAQLEPIFTEVYGSMRAWWGKLFRSDFFLGEYEAIWKTSPPLLSPIDTCCMLGYLSRCSAFASIKDLLYFNRIRDSGTYSSRPMSRNRLFEADDLFASGVACLKAGKMTTQKNMDFLYAINWGYISEALRGLKSDRWGQTPAQKLHLLADALNNPVVRQRKISDFPAVWLVIKPYISMIWKTSGRDPVLWSSYLVRLYDLLNKLEQKQHSSVDFLMLLSCLCDPENKSRFGASLLKGCKATFSTGERSFLDCCEREVLWFYQHPADLLGHINKLDGCEEEVFRQDLQVLAGSLESGDLVSACDLLADMGETHPCDREVFQARIYLADMIGETDLARQLAYAAKVLWPEDPDTQALCLSVLFQTNQP